jgi:hypothetical protein
MIILKSILEEYDMIKKCIFLVQDGVEWKAMYMTMEFRFNLGLRISWITE